MWINRTVTALCSVLLLAGCGDGEDADVTTDDGGESEVATPEPEPEPAGGATEDEPAADPAGDSAAVGTVTVDGETRTLDRITGVLSCDFDEPAGDFRLTARSEDGATFLNLTTFGEDPGGNEFSVAVDDVEYVTESPDDVTYDIDGRTVSGSVDVVPLFDEGSAQPVMFEVTCPGA